MRAQQPLAILLLVFQVDGVFAQCEGNLFVNGDMNGTQGANSVADGWTIVSGSPDLNDEDGPLLTTPGFSWTSQPTASPNGGTWQNLFVSEAISQQVSTLPGSIYSVCFYYAQQPITQDFNGDTLDTAWSCYLLANGQLFFITPSTAANYMWLQACTSFTATTSISTISIHGSSGYGAIDGLCMQVDHTNGVQGALRDALRLFPNPASDHVQVMGGRFLASATLTNAAGQSMPLELNGYRISLTGVEPGIYTVREQ